MQDDAEIARIEDVIGPVLRDHGLTLVDLDWRRHRPRGLLRLTVDKPGGVGIVDCERVSREVGGLLDAAQLIPERYDLEVSSPGLDRLLRTEREYQWATGRRVRCWLSGGREVTGRLQEVGPERLVLEGAQGPVVVARAEVHKARLDPEVPWARRA